MPTSDHCAASEVPGAPDCHCGSSSSKTLVSGALRVALAGVPSVGKTSIYSALTDLHAKTGNYLGVTVAWSLGICQIGEAGLTIEDLLSTYSPNPISPGEQAVRDVLTDASQSIAMPDALVVVVDAMTLRRGLNFVAETPFLELPTCLVVTMTDKLTWRAGRLDVVALGQALGIPAVRVAGNRGTGIPELHEHFTDIPSWQRPPLPAPTEPTEVASWADSILEAADYQVLQQDRITTAVDKVLLNPVLGSLVFFAITYIFFQAISTWAAPFQDAAEGGFDALGELMHGWPDESYPLLAGPLGDGLIGGVGAALTFVPQITIMFLIIASLEGVGYMSRVAFLMDRIMSRIGLEGRTFAALLSSFACTIPGIMATRTLPSAKDRVATMLAAPLTTCSAWLPVYVLLASIMVPADAKIGPLSARGTVMFALYLLGAVSVMVAAWVVKRLTDRGGVLLPPYMEMPPYRMPRPRTALITVWDAYKGFAKKAGTTTIPTIVIPRVLLNVPMRSEEQFNAHCSASAECAAVSAAMEDPASSTIKGDGGKVVTDPEELGKPLDAQKTSYTIDNSWAAAIGKMVQPIFEPLGFERRINVAILSPPVARETFAAILGQIVTAENLEEPSAHLATTTYQKDTLANKASDQLFNPATIAAILVFFVYALQYMATAVAMRRKIGTWKRPVITYTYMFVTAWVMATPTRVIVAMLIQAGLRCVGPHLSRHLSLTSHTFRPNLQNRPGAASFMKIRSKCQASAGTQQLSAPAVAFHSAPRRVIVQARGMATPEFIVSLRQRTGHDMLRLPGVSIVVVDEAGWLLLGRYADNRRWAVASDILKSGEQPAVATRRECLEETGVDVEVLTITGVTVGESLAFLNRDNCVSMDINFVGRARPGSVDRAHVADDEPTQVGWFAPDVLPESLLSSIPGRIEATLAWLADSTLGTCFDPAS